METFNTNKGQLNETQLVSALTYISYKFNRDDGLTHQQIVGIGLGNEAMRLKYENEKRGMALQGLLAKDSWAEQIVKDVSGNTIKLYTEASVKCADALIAELNKTEL